MNCLLQCVVCLFLVSNAYVVGTENTKKQLSVTSAGGAEHFVYLGNVVTVYNVVNSDGNQVIEAAFGFISDSPDLWTKSTVSHSINSQHNSTPHLYHNSIGDALIVWQFCGVNGVRRIAAAMKPNDASSWNSAILSSETENAKYMDVKGSIDEEGNVMVTWTSESNNVNSVRGVTSTMGTSTTFSPIFTISR